MTPSQASLASNEGDIWAWLFGLSTIRNRRVDLPHTAPQAAAAGGAAPAAPPAAEEGRRLLVELSGEVSQVVVGRVNATSSGSSALSNLTVRRRRCSSHFSRDLPAHSKCEISTLPSLSPGARLATDGQ